MSERVKVYTAEQADDKFLGKTSSDFSAAIRYELKSVTKSGTETINSVVYDKYIVNDFAINTINLTTSNSVRIYMPEYTTDSARDFVVKINVTASTAPSVTFVKSAKDTSVGFEASDEDWQKLELGINYFSFTESER